MRGLLPNGTPLKPSKNDPVKCTYRQKQKAKMKAAGFTSKKAYKKWLKKQKNGGSNEK